MTRDFRGAFAGLWIAIGVAALCLLTAGGSMTSTDGVAAFDLTQSLVERHSIAASRDIVGKEAYRGLDGRYYSPFGIAQSIWNVPFYLAGRAAARHLQGRTAAAIPKAIVALGTVPAVALLAWASFELLIVLGAAPLRAVDAAIVAVFATPLWPYSGFGFDQPLAGLFLWAAVLCTARAKSGRVAAAIAAGILAGFAGLTRQEMFAAALLLFVFLLAAGRRRAATLAAFVLGWLPLVSAWGYYNSVRFGSFWDSGYLRDATPEYASSIASGAAGLLFSGYSSLFLYCPAAILAAAGFLAMNRRARAAAWLFFGLFAGFFLVYASLGNWMGGRSYGPRYLVPLIPALVLPLAFWSPTGWRQRCAAAVILLSVAVQLPGVLVDYSKVRVSEARAGETTAQDMRWSRAPLLLNARATIAVVPAAAGALVGLRPVPRIPAGNANLDEALASSPDLWWTSLLYLGVIGPRTALAIAVGLLLLGCAALWQGRRLAAGRAGVPRAFEARPC
jgi:hypothetical protein